MKKNKRKLSRIVVASLSVVIMIVATIVPTFALSYVEPSEAVNLEKWQALEMVHLTGVDRSFTMAVDTHYGADGTYTLTNNNGDALTTLVSGNSTKKINLEPTLGEEYTLTDVSLKFRDFSVVYDTADALNFLPINDIYICLDDSVGSSNVGFNISFILEGYAVDSSGNYVLTPTGFSLDVNIAVSDTGGVVVNNSYASRIKVNDIINRLIATRSEWSAYYKNVNGYAIGGVRNLEIAAINTNGGNNPLFVGLVTTARNNGKNNNNEYMFARLPDVVIPGANAGYDQGYSDGYQKGHLDGYEEGFEDGSTYEGDGYLNGYNDGLSVGYENGKADGLEEGYTTGKAEGLDEGETIGYNKGFDEGYDSGYKTAENWGKEGWYQEGYDVGYIEGYDKGVEYGSTIPTDIGDFLSGTIGSFLGTKLFGDITVGMLLLIPITIPLVVMFLKLFAGG